MTACKRVLLGTTHTQGASKQAHSSGLEKQDAPSFQALNITRLHLRFDFMFVVSHLTPLPSPLSYAADTCPDTQHEQAEKDVCGGDCKPKGRYRYVIAWLRYLAILEVPKTTAAHLLPFRAKSAHISRLRLAFVLCPVTIRPHFITIDQPFSHALITSPGNCPGDELYGYMTLSKDWKDGVLSIIMRGMSKNFSDQVCRLC